MGQSDMFATFERMGEAQVRALATTQWQNEWQTTAFQWLKAKEDEAKMNNTKFDVKRRKRGTLVNLPKPK